MWGCMYITEVLKQRTRILLYILGKDKLLLWESHPEKSHFSSTELELPIASIYNKPDDDKMSILGLKPSIDTYWVT